MLQGTRCAGKRARAGEQQAQRSQTERPAPQHVLSETRAPRGRPKLCKRALLGAAQEAPANYSC